MRKNCTKAFAAFLAGRSARPAQSIWTDGNTIYSYRTAILTKVPNEPRLAILNVTQYSATTSVHQHSLAVALGQEGWHWFEVEGFSRGCDFVDLLDAARSQGSVHSYGRENYTVEDARVRFPNLFTQSA